MKYLYLFVLILFLSSCSSKSFTLFQGEPCKTETLKTDINFENKIAPKDRLSIEVTNIYNQSGLGMFQNQTNQPSVASSSILNSNSGFLVGSDGKVFLPLLGYVHLAGLTPSQASEKLTKAYKKYLKQPFVKVSILNQRIYVLGEVNKPGVVPVLNETMTIYEAIARSGDFTDYAKRDTIKILNTKDHKIRTLDMTSLKMLSSSNIILKPNDIVYVQPRDMKGFNVGVKETLPILQAISQAITTFASIKYLDE